MRFIKSLSQSVLLFIALYGMSIPCNAQTHSPSQQLALDIYKELVGINTVTPTGDTAKAAEAMAARLRAAGFARLGRPGL